MILLFSLLLMSSVIPIMTSNDYNFNPISNYKERISRRDLKISDMGAMHNHILSLVHKKVLNEFPADRYEFSRIIYEEIVTLCEAKYCNESNCEEEFFRCEENINPDIDRSHEEVQQVFGAGSALELSSMVNSKFPTDFDPFLKTKLIEVFESVYLLEELSLDEVHTVMLDILEDVENSGVGQNVNDAVEIVTSIAMGSAAYWMSPDNVYHQLHVESRRIMGANNLTLFRTVTDYLYSPMKFVLCDVFGSIVGVICFIPWTPLYVIPQQYILGFACLMIDVVISAIEYSLAGIGIYLPSPIDLLRCFIGDHAPPFEPLESRFPVGGSLVVDVLNLAFPPSCNATWLFGDVLGGFINRLGIEFSSDGIILGFNHTRSNTNPYASKKIGSSDFFLDPSENLTK